MNKEIARILKNRLVGLSFSEVIGGLAQAVSIVRYGGTIGTDQVASLKIVKKLPVTYDMAAGSNIYLGMEQELVPNQNKKSIIYFEDFGTNSDPNGRAGTLAFISQIRLACWINRRNIGNGSPYAELTSKCIDEILHRIVTGKALNENGITRLFVNNPRFPIQDANIFSRYNYDEVESQYLRPPFEYFAIDFTARYTMRSLICAGEDYVPTVFEQMAIKILIKDNPLPADDPANVQILHNGWRVPVEYPAGATLELAWLKDYSVLQPMVINERNVTFPPYDSHTGIFDFTTTETQWLYNGDIISINASLPTATLNP